ncbi:hypothetical protein ABT392_08245 [Paucibacter sp. JuS9]|uniref:hypothetical protein n=1 Tax=Paucibacter sp. JuS9 TaxID=3228748 RepID=UPI003757B9F7
MPNELKIPLGLAVNARPTVGAILDRARERIKLINAGQGELSYMSDADFIRNAKLVVIDGAYTFESEIPVLPQEDMFGHGSAAARRRFGNLARQDEAMAQAVDITVEALQKSSVLVQRVADIMSTATDPAGELFDIERREGLKTRPARHFNYFKQESFSVVAGDAHVAYESTAVRASVSPYVDPIQLLVELASTDHQSFDMRALVKEVMGEGLRGGVSAGGLRPFRFAGFGGWQQVVLTAAQWLKMPIRMNVVETVSTCSLKPLPADVHCVEGWPLLLDQVIPALDAVRAGLREQGLGDCADTVL